MAGEVAHAHEPVEARLPRIAWGVIALVALLVAAAWLVTWRTSDDFNTLMARQLAGAAPSDTLLYLALSAVMMVAMMLPSALPMLEVYHGLSAKDAGPREARVRAWLFGAGYFVAWTAFTALSLVVLMAFGVLGGVGGWAAFAPGALLVGAGVYQLTGWKQFCLRHCRSPMGFIMTHWRKGRGGALRVSLSHAAYCLGCCWLLMLVLFVAGAMSILWMGVLAGLVLVEKTWSRGAGFARALGVACLAVGALALGMAWLAPLSTPMDGGMGGMEMG